MPPFSLSPSPSFHSAVGPHFTSLPFATDNTCKSLLPFPSLTTLNSRWALACLFHPCMHLGQHLYIPVGSHISFTFWVLPFYVWVMAGAPQSSMQVFCHLHLIFYTFWWTILELGEGKTFNCPELLFSPGPSSMGFLLAGPWTGQRLLCWNLGLRGCYLNSTIAWSLKPRLPQPLHPRPALPCL